MKPFFTLKQTQSKSRPDGKPQTCTSCGLLKHCITPRMQPHGNFKKHIMIIGDAPTQVDDEQGKPWQSKTGRFLKKTLKKLGIDLWEDCMSLYAVCCRPVDCNGKTRAIGPKEASSCRKAVLKWVQEYQPKIIILLGNIPLESLIGHRWPNEKLGGINKWRGWQIPDQDFKAWVCPTFHPQFVIYEDKPDVEVIWEQDLKKALSLLDTSFLKWQTPTIHYIQDLAPLDVLENIQVVIDYETTGLKPYAQGQRIICAAVAINENTAYAFLMPSTKKARQPFLKLLANNRVGKIAHNMKFEENWSVTKLKQPVLGWDWDSMVAAHIMDNRQGVTGLKFQTYVNFGVIDYASEVTPYLNSKNDKNNNINDIHELLKSKAKTKLLLEYCAMDTIATYRLAMKQIKEINYSFLPF